MALASLLQPAQLEAAPPQGVLTSLPLPQRAKRVIWLTMAGGPSQLETFDHKPMLAEMHGKPMPESFTKGQQLAQLQGQQLICFGPQHPFAKFGKNQIDICALFPQIGSVIDDICLIRSMTTEAINHDPAHMFMNTGSQIAGRPSMGAWVTYGLGSESENLPGFVVLTSLGAGGQNQPIAARQWSSGFLPSRYQGVQLRSQGRSRALSVEPGGRVAGAAGGRRARHWRTEPAAPGAGERPRDCHAHRAVRDGLPDAGQRTGLMDIRSEAAKTLELYGCQPGDGSFAGNCLLARRLAERGVRFIQLYHKDWDHHSDVKDGVALKAKEIDRACMALITDLKQRGMFDDTLVVWGGEFGRTPMSQGGNGRDHHNKAMTVWLAGGGIRGGLAYGATDDLGYAAVENVCNVHDLHATMLHQLGIDHEAFSVKFQGLNAKLSGVEGARIIRDIVA